MSRVVVVGWDGATWDLLDRLADQGHLPNLQGLAARGARGPLRSTTPPVTAPAWVSMATGVNPGRHGCFDFNRPDGAGGLRPVQSWDIREKTFYEVLEERGRRSILVNLPVTFPPLTGQVTITSLMTRGDEAVFPPEVRERHPELRGYRIFPDTSLRVRGLLREYLADIWKVEEGRSAAVKALWGEPWDLFWVVVSGTDWASHEAFPQLLEGRFGEVPLALEVFHHADRLLGWIASALGPGDHLLLVSDHGFRPAKGVFFLNEWLVREGYARPDFRRPAFPPSHRMERAAQEAVAGGAAAPPPWVLRGAYVSRPARFLAKAYRRLGGAWPASLVVDPATSRAFTPTAECLGVTLPGADEALCEEVKSRLQGLRDPDGAPVFPAVARREEVYGGPCVPEAPHLVLQNGPWGIAASLRALPGDPFARKPSGIHAPDGVFLGVGPLFREGAKAEGTSILDVAPALFYLLGEAIPEGLDGQLREGLFKDGTLTGAPPAYAPVSLPRRERQDLESDAIQDRLRGLGYMG